MIADDYKQFMMKYKLFAMDDTYVEHDLKLYADLIMGIKRIRDDMEAPIPDNMYVLGDFDPECPIYLQDSKGRVYEFIYDYKYSKPKKIADSLLEFLNQQIEYLDNLPIL